MKRLPRNPDVRDLVEAKCQGHYRQTLEAGKLGFRGWHERFRKLEAYLDLRHERAWLRRPDAANIVQEPKDWLWSSARFRDKFARCKRPPGPRPSWPQRVDLPQANEKSERV